MFKDYKKYMEQLNRELRQQGFDLELDISSIERGSFGKITTVLDLFFVVNNSLKEGGSRSVFIGKYTENAISYLKDKLRDDYTREWNAKKDDLIKQPANAGKIEKVATLLSDDNIQGFMEKIGLSYENNEELIQTEEDESNFSKTLGNLSSFGGGIFSYLGNESGLSDIEGDDEESEGDYDEDDFYGDDDEDSPGEPGILEESEDDSDNELSFIGDDDEEDYEDDFYGDEDEEDSDDGDEEDYEDDFYGDGDEEDESDESDDDEEDYEDDFYDDSIDESDDSIDESEDDEDYEDDFYDDEDEEDIDESDDEDEEEDDFYIDESDDDEEEDYEDDFYDDEDSIDESEDEEEEEDDFYGDEDEDESTEDDEEEEEDDFYGDEEEVDEDEEEDYDDDFYGDEEDESSEEDEGIDEDEEEEEDDFYGDEDEDESTEDDEEEDDFYDDVEDGDDIPSITDFMTSDAGKDLSSIKPPSSEGGGIPVEAPKPDPMADALVKGVNKTFGFGVNIINKKLRKYGGTEK